MRWLSVLALQVASYYCGQSNSFLFRPVKNFQIFGENHSDNEIIRTLSDYLVQYYIIIIIPYSGKFSWGPISWMAQIS
jgi:hypothetical protein